MRIEEFSFGSITLGGKTYDHDVVVEAAAVRKRDKGPSKALGLSGHTPLSASEAIPWKCRRLVIGTGAYGRLPVLDDLRAEAKRRGVELLIRPTEEIMSAREELGDGVNAILHITC